MEFAIVAPIFTLLMLGTADVSRILYYMITLQHSVREAGRFVMTGNTVEGETRIDTAISIIRKNFQLTIEDEDIEISSVAGNGTMVPGPGGPGDIVTIHVRSQVAMITPLFRDFFSSGSYTVDAATSFRNEAFDTT